MMEEFFFGETPMPKPIKDSSGEKGLLNYLGENNCFLNVVIQSLWHLEAFRQKFTSEKELHKHQEHCVYCSLEVIFTQYAFSEESRLPPTVLRETMAILFRPSMKFQLYELDDAAEAFDAILHCLHSQLVDENSLTALNHCTDSNCVAHKVFGIDTIEQIKCQSCGAATEPIHSQIRTVYTYSAALRDTYHKDPSLQFCQYLRKASEEDKRPCPNKDACKAQCPIVHYLTGAPEVFTVSIVWDSEESTIYDINTVLKIISMNIDLSNIFVVENKSITTNYRLRGMICYYGKHYIAFFYNHTLKQWYVFDDTNVKAVGKEWSDIQDRCVRGKLQPSVLFYEKIVEEEAEHKPSESTLTISPISTMTTATSMVTNMSHFKISTVLPTIIEEEEDEIVKKPSISLIPELEKVSVIGGGSPKNGIWPRSPEESFIVIPKQSRNESLGDVDFVVTRTNWLYRRQVRIFRFTDHCFKRIIPASGEEKHIFDYKDVFQVTIVDDHNIIISFYSGKEAQYIQSEEALAIIDLLKAKCKAKGHTFRIVKQ